MVVVSNGSGSDGERGITTVSVGFFAPDLRNSMRPSTAKGQLPSLRIFNSA